MKKKFFECNWAYYIPIIIVSFVLLFFWTASSPRYAINSWDDANAFFTVGKCMMHGIIPYKDVFEQKGPLLYLIHGIAYLISKTSFTGVYIVESIAMAVFSICIFKTANLFLNKTLSFVTAITAFVILVNSFCFFIGDSAEELSLPFMGIGLYFFVKYFKNSLSEKISKRCFIIIGFLAGCVAMIKFTVIGFFFGWMALISIHTLFVRKDIKNAFLNAILFICGMLLAFVPWLIYFAANHALKDFIDVYFIINSTAYSNDNSALVKAIDIPFVIKNRFLQFPAAIGFSAVGALIPIFYKDLTDGKFLSRISQVFLFGCVTFFIFYGGREFTYYYLPLMAFMFFDIVFVLHLFSNKVLKKLQKNKAWVKNVISVAVAVLIAAYAFWNNPVFRNIEKNKDVIFQEKVSEYIQSHNPNGTILCYGALDAGVYLLDDYTNVFKHFERQNIDKNRYEENCSEQDRYINDHEAYYVVTVNSEKAVKNDPEAIYSSNETLKNDYNLCYQQNVEILSQRMHNKDKMIYCLFELEE